MELKCMIGIYVRLSVENSGSQDKESVIKNQIADCKKFIEENEIPQDIKIYSDNGYSGRNFNRPEFQRLVCDIEAGTIDTVVVKDLSRLGRNVVEVGYYLEQYFPSKKVRFVAINDKVDTAIKALDSHMQLQIVLKNMVHEMYTIQTSKKIKSVKQQQAKNGQFIGSTAPYGYEKTKDNPHKLQIDHGVSETVRMIFEWFADGMSVYTICKTLNSKNIATPTQYRKMKNPNNRNRVSLSWQQKTVKQILSSKVYLGHIVQQQKTVYDIVENMHEPIVSEVLFAKVKARLQEIAQKNEHISWRDNATKVDALKGKIECATCKKKFRLQKSGKYLCGTNRECIGNYCTNKTTISEEMVYAMLRQWLLLYQPQLLLQEKEASSEKIKKEIDEIRFDMKSEEKKRKQQFELYAKNEITKKEYLQFKTKSDIILQEKTDKINILNSEENHLNCKTVEELLTKGTVISCISHICCAKNCRLYFRLILKK